MENESSFWGKAYRQAGGSELPMIAGRKLSESDPKMRSQAVRLLSSSTPLPREMIAALLRRKGTPRLLTRPPASPMHVGNS